ncbi:MAG: OmpH family outer membrane protein [Anaeromyxobacteraceae bacterium]
MQKLPVALATLLALGLAGAPARARAEQKLAFVDLQRALNEVDEGKTAKAALKREFDQKQKTLDEKKGEFDKLRGEFEKQAVVMSDDARKERQGELERKQMELQGLFVQMQKELSERERETTRGIFDKMHAIVSEIAEQEGVALVLTAEALVFATPSLDFTNELVRKYNARHKPGSGGKAAAGAEKKGGAEKKPTAKKEGK